MLADTTQEIAAKQAPSLVDTFLAIIPTNPFAAIVKGDVLPIGGLKEKTMAAYISGIKSILVPYGNKSDIEKAIKRYNDINEAKKIKSLDDIIVKNDMEVERRLTKRMMTRKKIKTEENSLKQQLEDTFSWR